jgi:hypothetical protein
VFAKGTNIHAKTDLKGLLYPRARAKSKPVHERSLKVLH